MINGVPQSKEEYDAIINPDETARRIAIIKQGMQAATARSAAKKRMIERLAWKKKRAELQERFAI